MTSQFDYIHPVPPGHSHIRAQHDRIADNLRDYPDERRQLLMMAAMEYWCAGDMAIRDELGLSYSNALAAGDLDTAASCVADAAALLIRLKRTA